MSRGRVSAQALGPRYKWVALSNTTLAMLLFGLNSSSVIIALPAIFRGIRLNPLDPGNFNYLLWVLMGYLLVAAVLVVTLGRIGDIFGRVRMYNLGFALFTLASILLSLTWSTGAAGALELIVLRMLQAVGGAMLMANTAAILTDAFPASERGMALGVSMAAALGGSFIGLVAGGVLATVNWRLVFLINVPVGVIGTVWAYWKLHDIGRRTPARIDWLGNVTFAAGLGLLLVGITYGIKPYGGHAMGWSNPFVFGSIAGGLALLCAFVLVERRVAEPMFRLELFRIRAFSAGNVANLLSSVGNGGLQFMLIIWLQGIWLPLHGYSFQRTPLWAGIYLLPLTFGFLVAGPVSGHLSDRYGARPFATGGMLLVALAFGLMILLPVDFAYPLFAALIFLFGVGFGMFVAPNTAGIMNSVPARHRGAASGMRATFQGAGTPLSIGVFFSLMIVGLSATMPQTVYQGLTANGVPGRAAAAVAKLPPVGDLFAAFLGSNPVRTVLPRHVLGALPPGRERYLTGTRFFPRLMAGPFHQGLTVILSFGLAMSLVAAAASWLRGGKYVHDEASEPDSQPPSPTAEALTAEQA
jgi:MFS family permease